MHVAGQAFVSVLIACLGAAYLVHAAGQIGSALPAPARQRAQRGAKRVRSAARNKVPPRVQRVVNINIGRRPARHPAPRRPAFRRLVIRHEPQRPLQPGVVRLDDRRRPAPQQAPAPAPARPAATEAKPMGTSTLTPGGAGADLFTAITHVISHANAGGVQSKLRAITQFDEGLEFEASSLSQFAQRLAEPDQLYPPSVWEPVAAAAAHMKAAQMAMAEAGSALRQVMSTTVGEANGSGVKVPHHQQINSGQ